eukprot:gnl/Hemi2/22699_TR7580_c0_g1_i1.p1 gnl/Hemi2/22699_TR7580_c0_g1~~gnl/Hemi2/22699_TR7580_c0_g1_i1.p1  ORF type:complete len:161 (+),score=28.75 gnl/Hemi2/22699_TR7580_c0_g1_i1:368-850(+)
MSSDSAATALAAILSASSYAGQKKPKTFMNGLDDLRTLHSSIHSHISKVRAVVMKQFRKEELRAASDSAKPTTLFCTRADLAGAEELLTELDIGFQTCVQTLTALQKFAEDACHKQDLYLTYKLKESKARKHCEHCAGRKASCGCRHNCSRPPKSRCTSD